MWLLWLLSFIITVIAALYQTITGPSYPDRIKVILKDKEYKLKLPRSSEGKKNAEIIFLIPDTSIKAKIHYCHYRTNCKYETINFIRGNKYLVVKLPNIPPAYKYQYYIEFISDNEIIQINKKNPIIIRYRGAVPSFIMAPHIFLMFLGMLLSNLTGLMVFFKKKNLYKYSLATLSILTIGGIVLGCLVQKYAFGEYWTGVPFGWDLTDNKTLLAVIVWFIAVILSRKKEKPYLILLASIIILLIFSIPHSLYGSEEAFSTSISAN